MYSSAYVWAKVLGHMESRLTPQVVSTWFDDTEILELTDEKLVLYSPLLLPKGYHRPPLHWLHQRGHAGNFPDERRCRCTRRHGN